MSTIVSNSLYCPLSPPRHLNNVRGRYVREKRIQHPREAHPWVRQIVPFHFLARSFHCGRWEPFHQRIWLPVCQTIATAVILRCPLHLFLPSYPTRAVFLQVLTSTCPRIYTHGGAFHKIFFFRSGVIMVDDASQVNDVR